MVKFEAPRRNGSKYKNEHRAQARAQFSFFEGSEKHNFSSLSWASFCKGFATAFQDRFSYDFSSILTPPNGFKIDQKTVLLRSRFLKRFRGRLSNAAPGVWGLPGRGWGAT